MREKTREDQKEIKQEKKARKARKARKEEREERKEKKEREPKEQKLSAVRRNRYAILAFFATVLLMLFLWFCTKMSPFGDRTILRVDLYHQYGPLFAELYERLKGLFAGRSLLYSWNTGLGGNFLGNFFNYLSSPTGLIVLLFGHKNIPEAIATMVLIKGSFAAGFFAYALQKIFKKQDVSTAAFGVLYAFCGFMIAYYWNVMWLDALALLPLVVLGIHQILHKQRFLLYTLSLALTLMANYYMGFMVCVFGVLFFLAELYASSEPSPLEEAPEGFLARIKQNKRLESLLLFGFGSLMAGALAAVVLLPTYYALKNSSATSGSFPQGTEFYFSIFDFLANHFADMEITWRSSGDLVLPNVYSGVAVLLLVPLYLVVPSISWRKKVPNVLLLLFFFFSFNLNTLNFLWHAMHFPNDLPWRFSFLYSFLLLWVGYQTVTRIREIPARTTVTVGVLVTGFLIVTEKLGHGNLQPFTVWITLGFLVAYTCLFAALRRAPEQKQRQLAFLLFFCVLTEVCAADIQNFEVTQIKKNFVVEWEDFTAVKKKVLAQDRGLFRMEVTDSRTLMDPAFLDYPGVSVFSSMANEHTAKLEYQLGLGSNEINSYTYNPNTPVYNAMHHLKYLVENQTRTESESPAQGSSYLNALAPAYYRERPEFTRERFTVFENKYPLALAFWAEKAVRDWAPENTGGNPFLAQMEFWERASGVPDVFTPARLIHDAFGENEGGVGVSVNDFRQVEYYGKKENQRTRLSFTVEVDEPQNVYFCAKGGANKNWISAVQVQRGDALEDRSHNHPAIWDLGWATPEEPLSIIIVLSGEHAPENGTFDAWLYGLNEDAFRAGYGILNRGALDVLDHSDTHIYGTITAPKDGVLYTSIPYDEGWAVAVDGVIVPVSQYIKIGNGAFLGIPLSAGSHNLALRFRPLGLSLGTLVSGASLGLLLALLLLLWWYRKYAARKEPEAPVRMFATGGLTPESFSLDLSDEEMPPSVPETRPEPIAERPKAPETEPVPEKKPEPEPEIEMTQQINTMLKDMQARAEELRRKMHAPAPKPEDPEDSGQFGRVDGVEPRVQSEVQEAPESQKNPGIMGNSGTFEEEDPPPSFRLV